MIDALVVPVRVDLSEFGGDAVVFAHDEHVSDGEHQLLVDTRVTGHEAEGLRSGADASVVRILRLLRKQVLESEILEDLRAPEQTALEGAQTVGRFLVGAVDEVGVQGAGDEVELRARAQFAVGFEGRRRAHEFHATAAEERVERIVGRNLDGPAFRMALVGRSVAARRVRLRHGICARQIHEISKMKTILMATGVVG